MAMDRMLSNKQVVARKEYECMASEAINAGDPPEDWLDEAELKIWNEAKVRGFKIQPGEKHVYQTGIYERDFFTYRAITAMHDICIKYDLFED